MYAADMLTKMAAKTVTNMATNVSIRTNRTELLTGVMFSVPLCSKWILSETILPDNLLARTE